jgi:heme/copper-type cytochrome/quinol oxidase subunit 2
VEPTSVGSPGLVTWAGLLCGAAMIESKPRRIIGTTALTAAVWLIIASVLHPVPAQDQAPGRHEFTIVARDFQFSPNRVEVDQDDLVKVIVRSEDRAYGFAIDQYRIVRRVPPGGTTTVEFRADRAGTFRFYSHLTGEPGHGQMQGNLVVQPR